MLPAKSPVVPFFSNPLLHRFLQVPDNRRLLLNVIMTRQEADRWELERRFADHFLEMRFLGFIRKHIHYEALHLLRKNRSRHQQEALSLNSRVYRDEGQGLERLELLEDPGVSVEEEVIERTVELDDLTSHPDLHEAIQGLTQKQQTVLYLLYVQQLTEQEAADLLKISQQAINKIKKQSLSRIRRQLGTGIMPQRKQVKG